VSDQIAANKRRSVALVVAFMVLVFVVAGAFSMLLSFGPVGVVVALVVAASAAFAGYRKSDSVVLAMSHAQVADEDEWPQLHNIVDGLCVAAGLSKPRLYIIEDDAPNAFATGRSPKHSAIAVTTGMMEKMSRIELEAVVAHELSHIRNYDTLVMTLAVTMVGSVALMSDFSFRFLWWGGPRHRDDQDVHRGIGSFMVIFGLVTVVFAPLAARLLHLAISRRREFLADVSAAELTRYPPGLISALEKLRDDGAVVHSASKATAHLWIESPLPTEEGSGKHVRLNRLFDTHPQLEERIALLREL